MGRMIALAGSVAKTCFVNQVRKSCKESAAISVSPSVAFAPIDLRLSALQITNKNKQIPVMLDQGFDIWLSLE